MNVYNVKVYIFIHNILLKYLKNALFYFLLCLLAWFLDRFPPSRPDWSLTFSPPASDFKVLHHLWLRRFHS